MLASNHEGEQYEHLKGPRREARGRHPLRIAFVKTRRDKNADERDADRKRHQQKLFPTRRFVEMELMFAQRQKHRLQPALKRCRKASA